MIWRMHKWPLAAAALLVFGSSLPGRAQPFAATQQPTGITTTNAALNGMATANGLPSLAWFEWWFQVRSFTFYGIPTPPVEVGSGNGVVAVGAGINNLIAGQVYHTRL